MDKTNNYLRSKMWTVRKFRVTNNKDIKFLSLRVFFLLSIGPNCSLKRLGTIE